MSHLKIALSLFALCLMSAHAGRFDIVNQCSYTVWPAAIPVGGGVRLDPGQTWSLDIPTGTARGKIWGRTGCNFDNSGNGNCQTGGCGTVLNCTLPGKPPITRAEFTLELENYDVDYFDLSVVDGFNIPMQIASTTKDCNEVITCQNPSCPDAYHNPRDNTKLESCPAGTNFKVVFCP